MLSVPPLRERRADIPLLLNQFVSQLASRHGVRPPRFTRQAKALLLQHDWPGNVRELRNVLETLCLLREGRPIRVADLPESIRLPEATRDAPTDKAAPSSKVTLALDEGLEVLIRQIVESALELDGGNKAKAAERLRISIRTVQRYVASGRVRGTPINAAS
jgi:DNA-binding NtrC family response regulator